ncbi:MAG: response regulator [Kiritimatiellae bacterium]|jgi:two-component system response regulator FixJ|nr:response regulator [Kiritimatiellia bacterium]
MKCEVDVTSKMWNKSVIYVVDDDEQVLKATGRLLKAVGYEYELFSGAQQFIDAPIKQADACCALLDIRMPGMSGIELQKYLVENKICIPVVFVTGHGDVETSVDAFRNGAVHFLTKPYNDDQLLAAVSEALIKNYGDKVKCDLLDDAKKGFSRLTAREREIFSGVVRGMRNKDIATMTGITETTVKVHRARVMDKMQAVSVASLVQMSIFLIEAGLFDRDLIEKATK